MNNLIYKEESYKIIGLCFEVHNYLGSGFREQRYEVKYKDVILEHKFYADFVVYDKIILEIKGVKAITDEFVARTINYLKVSDLRLGLIVNFGENKLVHKRIIV